MTAPFYERHGVTVHAGDALDVLAELPDSSMHAVVCDPPYGLAEIRTADVVEALTAWCTGDRAHIPDRLQRGFMGTVWDRFVPPPAVWDQCLRVLRPGGYLLAFSAPRTLDLMGISIRLAGFQTCDNIMCWINSQGMPKGLNVGKAIDARGARDAEAVAMLKAELRRVFDTSGMTLGELNERCGFEASGYLRTSSTWATLFPPPEKWARMREVIGGDDQLGEKFRAAEREVIRERTMTQGGGTALQMRMGEVREVRADITAPATDAARQWEGWNTALAPAQEPIVVARKPLAGTVAVNVLQHGVGAFNIDSCKVDSGRWPSNVVFVHLPECGPDDTTPCADGCPVAELDQQSGTQKSSATGSAGGRGQGAAMYAQDSYTLAMERTERPAYGDEGGASRFYPTFRYEAKAPKHERPQVRATPLLRLRADLTQEQRDYVIAELRKAGVRVG